MSLRSISPEHSTFSHSLMNSEVFLLPYEPNSTQTPSSGRVSPASSGGSFKSAHSNISIGAVDLTRAEPQSASPTTPISRSRPATGPTEDQKEELRIAAIREEAKRSYAESNEPITEAPSESAERQRQKPTPVSSFLAPRETIQDESDADGATSCAYAQEVAPSSEQFESPALLARRVVIRKKKRKEPQPGRDYKSDSGCEGIEALDAKIKIDQKNIIYTQLSFPDKEYPRPKKAEPTIYAQIRDPHIQAPSPPPPRKRAETMADATASHSDAAPSSVLTATATAQQQASPSSPPPRARTQTHGLNLFRAVGAAVSGVRNTAKAATDVPLRLIKAIGDKLGRENVGEDE